MCLPPRFVWCGASFNVRSGPARGLLPLEGEIETTTAPEAEGTIVAEAEAPEREITEMVGVAGEVRTLAEEAGP